MHGVIKNRSINIFSTCLELLNCASHAVETTADPLQGNGEGRPKYRNLKLWVCTDLVRVQYMPRPTGYRWSIIHTHYRQTQPIAHWQTPKSSSSTNENAQLHNYIDKKPRERAFLCSAHCSMHCLMKNCIEIEKKEDKSALEQSRSGSP